MTSSLLKLPPAARQTLLIEMNDWLGGLTAQARVEWALGQLPETHVVSSSFGVQAAVMLHMMTQAKPDIPVVLIDTGYLFPETYRFIDELTERLSLNLHVTRAEISPAWQEVKYGELWKKGEDGIRTYNRMNKVEPMQRALGDLDAKTWFSGVRRVQAKSREAREIVEVQEGRIRVHPIVDWSNRTVHRYLTQHDLPYHPLWEKGYVSVGDTHTTAPLSAGMAEEDTRFGGLLRECGLHPEATPKAS
ncbi:MAG: phosphoadenylyl-sulfate reductase [Pseudomonadota bacterium]